MSESTTSASRQRKTRIAVVFGGRSSEHAISCVTAGSVLRVLDPERYEVLPIGISTDGRWVLMAGEETTALAITDGRLPARIDETSGALVTMAADPTARELTVHEPGSVPKVLGEVDVVFPLLHGPYGEDGTLQGLLDLAGVAYVGSGVLSSAVSMDKEFMKRLLASAGLPVGRYVTVRRGEWLRDRQAVQEAVAGLGFPVFVKPARAGSSMGISKVHGPEELAAAIEEAQRHDPKVVVEAMVRGREIEIGVLAGPGGRPRVSAPAEIKVRGGHEFYDFQAKYLDGSTDVVLPAELTDGQLAELNRLALAAFEALECEGLARVDFFLAQGDGQDDPAAQPYWLVNEVNTMPGFTPTSMYPQMWAVSGVSYAQLVDTLIAEALARPTGLR
ncbi:MAG TPA: D-alanine--D-alanine ligase family protein [Actinocrinis sp.]|uniref:D-alanine--D-alanine ligase family protein n=1 Tax=Actinocrinis sp. TaxID=1920516 RepID=UPI002DDCD335|nr:D-alanine--D-alanine ligase family protein [Actinocrinis sp.]HEV2347612.1 D-alanine--D-alanine ligase family protein [Actinocrinis sp.]